MMVQIAFASGLVMGALIFWIGTRVGEYIVMRETVDEEATKVHNRR